MAKLDDREKRHDRFYERAKREKFVARSVYKLEEIDQRVGLLRVGARVLDLGCRPGSWLQYASQRVGDRGALVGLDRTPLDIVIPRVRMVVDNVYKIDLQTLVGDLGRFDVVMSDMAPDTTGVRQMDQARCEQLFERALEIAEATLSPGGNFVGKLFQGPDFAKLVARVRGRFAQAKTIKPEGSRKESIEQYVVGLGFKG